MNNKCIGLEVNISKTDDNIITHSDNVLSTDQLNTTVDIKPKKIRKKPETVVCDKCGFSYKKNNKSHHMQTKKHNEAISVNKLKTDLKTLVDRF
jgi:hypothetical protein